MRGHRFLLHLRCGLAVLIALPAAVMLIEPAAAQAPVRVLWSARAAAVTPSALRAGAEVPVALVATIDAGWHMYSLTQPEGGPIALKVSVPDGQPFTLAGAVTGPEPEVMSDNTLGFPVELHSGATEFMVPLRVTTALPGPIEGRLIARYQVCSETICLPPRSAEVRVRIAVREGRRP